MEPANQEQSKMWNGPSGSAWIAEQELMDRMFAGFEALLVDEVRAVKARRVLDVGCGTGATTLAIARAGAECTGIDISEPMIALARERATREGSAARFLVADAQTHAFESAAFDLLVSRFGVMFFADPVAAFTNLRRALRPGCAMKCAVFRSVAENPFMTTAERAAAELIPNLPPRVPNAPGQFAFADPTHVRGILEGAGWRGVGLTRIDVPCAFPSDALERYITRFGPLGQVLQQADAATRAQVLGKVLAEFERYVRGGEVWFVAACWLVTAIAA